MEAPAERGEDAWWGRVITDSRFPALWDCNYARVEAREPSLAEVEQKLLPAIAKSGATHEHIVLPDPDAAAGILRELLDRGDRIGWDTWMRHEGEVPENAGEHTVEEIARFDEDFWAAQRRSFREFDVESEPAKSQLEMLERELIGLGKRWFTMRIDGQFAGFGALQRFADLAYIDNIITFPEARSQGIATAILVRLIAESAGCSDVLLLTQSQTGPTRLYERVGFAAGGRIASALRPLG